MSNLLNNKYKDSTPEITIKKIKNFFDNNTIFELRQDLNIQSESGTYSCRYGLYYDNMEFLGQNGKGTTEIFSQASGLAELYERFCNYYIINGANPLFSNLYQKKNKEKNSFYYTQEEKKLSKKEIYDSNLNNLFLERVAGSSKDIFLDLITENSPIGIPYYNVENKKEKKYYDPRLLSRIKASCGMSAGNSLEEALNQGISEILEIYTAVKFYSEPQEKYYIFTKADIQNKELKQIAEKIEEANDQSLFFIDLSYNFKTPVIASLLINHINCNIIMNFGCFPVFDIALERSLTELYQGIVSHFQYNHQVLMPYKNKTIGQIWDSSPGALGRNGVINENVFLKRCIWLGENYNYFLPNKDTINNLDILNKIIKIGKELNFNFYYHDNSLCEDIYAVDIVCDEMDMSYGRASIMDLFSPEEKVLSAVLGIKQREFIQDCFNNTINFEKYGTLKNFLPFLEIANPILIQGWPSLYYGTAEHDFDSLLNIFIKDNYIDPSILCYLTKNIFYKTFNYFHILRNYKETNLYADDEIFNFIKNIYKEAEFDDIIYCNDKEYVFKKAFLIPLINNYQNNFNCIIDNLI